MALLPNCDSSWYPKIIVKHSLCFPLTGLPLSRSLKGWLRAECRTIVLKCWYFVYCIHFICGIFPPNLDILTIIVRHKIPTTFGVQWPLKTRCYDKINTPILVWHFHLCFYSLLCSQFTLFCRTIHDVQFIRKPSLLDSFILTTHLSQLRTDQLCTTTYNFRLFCSLNIRKAPTCTVLCRTVFHWKE